MSFAHKEILRKPINLWKIDWNIAFIWLKHNVIPVQILWWSFFIYDVIQTSCFSVLSGKKVADFPEQSSYAFRRPSVLVESPEYSLYVLLKKHYPLVPPEIVLKMSFWSFKPQKSCFLVTVCLIGTKLPKTLFIKWEPHMLLSVPNPKYQLLTHGHV